MNVRGPDYDVPSIAMAFIAMVHIPQPVGCRHSLLGYKIDMVRVLVIFNMLDNAAKTPGSQLKLILTSYIQIAFHQIHQTFPVLHHHHRKEDHHVLG
jgi:hypothetical protein